MPRSKGSVAAATNGVHAPVSAPVSEEPKPRPGGFIIEAPQLQVMNIKVVGTTPLICSAFPDKLIGQMEESRAVDEAVQPKKGPRPARNFEQEFRDSMYPWPDGESCGFPAIAFKRAMVGACRQVSSFDMTMANRIIFVTGEVYIKGYSCVKIIGKPAEMRKDVVRVGSGLNKAPDVRFRAEFWPWSCWITVEFNSRQLKQEHILNLLLNAGTFEGVGEMRRSAPKKPFDYGCFTIGTKDN
jgi:hypothetical protein